MQKVIHRAADRGQVDLGWLKSAHSFSFGNYHDPSKMNFGALRVLNDDFVQPGKGFGRHPHNNMEIISIPLEGALGHQDSTSKSIETGDVQIMSAGTGIQHSEANHSADHAVKFLQIWVIPSQRNLTPSYDQKSYAALDRHNKFVTIVSPNKDDQQAVFINQDAYFNLADLDAQQTINYTLNTKSNGVYLFVLEGEVTVVGETLARRDAIGISAIEDLAISASQDAKLLLLEVPMI